MPQKFLSDMPVDKSTDFKIKEEIKCFTEGPQKNYEWNCFPYLKVTPLFITLEEEPLKILGRASQWHVNTHHPKFTGRTIESSLEEAGSGSVES